MSKQRTAFGLAVLFALVLSAFAAASASASGSTSFTCVKDALNGVLSGPHCLAGAGEYKHVAIAQDTTTTGTATNANTASGTTAAQSSIQRATLAGVNVEITCKEVHGEGTFENKKTGEEMFSHFEGVLKFSGCIVKAPAEKGCKVKGGAITTEPLTGRSLGAGETVKIEPINVEKRFTTITIEGCSIAALNNAFPVTGSFQAKGNGATQTTTHTDTTTQNTLRFGGQKAGLDGALTYKAHSEAGEETNPITATPTP